MFLVASFPRSGNHLVRFFIEYITGRATLGCIGNPADLPICTTYKGPELSHVDLSKPIARKAHFVREIREGLKKETYGKMILIRRDFPTALSSHLRDIRGLKRIPARLKSIRRYRALLTLYRDWPGPKLEVSYERLVSRDGANEIVALVAFLGDEVWPEKAAEAVAAFEALRIAYATSGHPVPGRAFESDIPKTEYIG